MGDQALIRGRSEAAGGSCAYHLGDLHFDGGRIITVIEADRTLYFIRDRSVFLGDIDSGLTDVEVDGGALAGRTEDGRIVRVPISADGPPTRMFGGAESPFFRSNPGDRSRVAYGRALRQRMGARYGRCDDPRSAGTDVRRVRVLLADRAAVLPDELGDASCIWREGTVAGEDGRRYEVYTHSYAFGLEQNPHVRQSVVVTQGNGQFLAIYESTGLEIGISGPDLLIGEWDYDARRSSRRATPSRATRVHFGTRGPPDQTAVELQVWCIQWPESRRCG